MIKAVKDAGLGDVKMIKFFENRTNGQSKGYVCMWLCYKTHGSCKSVAVPCAIVVLPGSALWNLPMMPWPWEHLKNFRKCKSLLPVMIPFFYCAVCVCDFFVSMMVMVLICCQ